MEDSKVKVILQAARNRFAHYGIAKTTMNEIAADIGMSKASLYYYFPDKERLFVAVIRQDMDQFVSAIENIISKPSKASFKLKKYVITRNVFFKTFINLAKLENSTVNELLTPVFNELKASLFQKEKELIAKILALGVQEKEFQKVDTLEYAELIISALMGLRSTTLTADLSLPEENFLKMNEQTTLFVEIVLKSVQRLS